jgi:glycosyltransferase involved in cell wall biosynthesis
MVQETSIADKIDIVAWQEDMSSCWHNIDCLVHTADKEPFGRVIIEAMANKIPVIAVNSCGPKEIICNGESGILLTEDDAEAFSEAMIKIANNKKMAERLAEEGYKTVTKEFTATQTAQKIKAIYEEILGM